MPEIDVEELTIDWNLYGGKIFEKNTLASDSNSIKAFQFSERFFYLILFYIYLI
jgi:hypothetical protein